MQISHLLGAGAALAALGWTLSVRSTIDQPAAPSLAIALAPPIENGHYVLVVEGDRDGLAITHASAKADPWAGVPKGFSSAWTLAIRDGRGALLAEVPLDVTPFAVGEAQKGQPVQVQGCVVRDSHIAMLVSVPLFTEAASYTFARPAAGPARVELGTTHGNRVRELAAGGR